MKLSDIIGHNEQVEHLIKAYRSDRLAHAYLFYGPDGIGKKSVARALAQYIFCENKDLPAESGQKRDHDSDSCSHCAPCRKISADNHPDLIAILPEKSVIKIDMIRELQHKLNFGKYDAKYKFCIIDEADKIRVEAANALLKTLEEPAKDTVIILVTAKINTLLPTIISRCQKVRFNPISVGEIKGELIRRYAVDSDEAEIIAAFSQGSFAKISLDNFSDIIELRRSLVKKIKEVSLSNLSGIINYSSEISNSDKEYLVETIEIIKTFYRDASMIKSGMTDYLINKDIVNDINRIALSMTHSELFEKVNIMSQIQSSLMANVNKKLALESMLIELCA